MWTGHADGLLLATETCDGQAWQALVDAAAALAALDPAGRGEGALRARLAAETGLLLEGVFPGVGMLESMCTRALSLQEGANALAVHKHSGVALPTQLTAGTG